MQQQSIQTFFHTSDEKRIQARLSWSSDDIQTIDKVAIIAHPYGSLGGNYNNNVVVAAEHYFTRQGYVAISYNARGVSGSTGRGSWDGEAECRDYQTIVDFCCDTSTSSQPEEPLKTFKSCRFTTLACVGYSYGSLAASSARVREGLAVYYVLISYPIGVLWALTRGRTSTFTQRLIQASNDAKGLIVYGDQDQFTGAFKYEAWARDIWQQQCRFEVKAMSYIDHFWGGCEDQLVEAIDQWRRKEVLH